jgi:hypothetical protein
MTTPKESGWREEAVYEVFQRVMTDLKQKYRVSDTLSDVLSDSLSKHLATAIAATEARVVEKLEGMKRAESPMHDAHQFYAVKDYNEALEDVRALFSSKTPNHD